MMDLTQAPTSLDREGQAIEIGAPVRFIMRGYFLPREQESFGIVESIDAYGGIRIKLKNGYKHFLSSKRVGDVSDTIYFTHHRYDAEKHARVYCVTDGAHELFIALF